MKTVLSEFYRAGEEYNSPAAEWRQQQKSHFRAAKSHREKGKRNFYRKKLISALFHIGLVNESGTPLQGTGGVWGRGASRKFIVDGYAIFLDLQQEPTQQVWVKKDNERELIKLTSNGFPSAGTFGAALFALKQKIQADRKKS